MKDRRKGIREEGEREYICECVRERGRGSMEREGTVLYRLGHEQRKIGDKGHERIHRF